MFMKLAYKTFINSNHSSSHLKQPYQHSTINPPRNIVIIIASNSYFQSFKNTILRSYFDNSSQLSSNLQTSVQYVLQKCEGFPVYQLIRKPFKNHQVQELAEIIFPVIPLSQVANHTTTNEPLIWGSYLSATFDFHFDLSPALSCLTTCIPLENHVRVVASLITCSVSRIFSSSLTGGFTSNFYLVYLYKCASVLPIF